MNPHVFENRLHQLALTLEDLNEYWDEYQSYDFLPAENRRIEREFAHKYYIITGEIYQDGDLGGFAPDSLPNLEFWLDSSDATTLFQDEAGTVPAVADTDPVGRWNDKSDNGWHLLSPDGVAGGNDTNRPALRTNIVNSLPVIRMNGTISFMRNSTVSIVGEELTIFIVSRRVAFVDANEALLSLASTGVDDFSNVEGTVVGHSVTANDVSDSRDDAVLSDLVHPANGTPFVYTSKYDGANQTGYLNGVAGTPAASTGAFSSERISIGFRNSVASISNPNNRDYLEIIIYLAALSDADREDVETYLFEKYAITP